MKSAGSVGDVTPEVSIGVGGQEPITDEDGVGRDGNAVGGAMGRVNDNRLAHLDEVDAERVERVSMSSLVVVDPGVGGGSIDSTPSGSS